MNAKGEEKGKGSKDLDKKKRRNKQTRVEEHAMSTLQDSMSNNNLSSVAVPKHNVTRVFQYGSDFHLAKFKLDSRLYFTWYEAGSLEKALLFPYKVQKHLYLHKYILNPVWK